MNFKFKLIFLINFVIASSFNGQIVDTYDQPISNASITLGKESTISDTDGFFTIKHSMNNFSVKISHIGYDDKVAHFSHNKKGLHKIILFKSTLELDHIVVTGLRKESHIKDTPNLTHVISSSDIKNTAYTNVKDILEMTMPNVQNVVSSHAGTSNNRVKIQGLDNRYILFLVDGARVSGEFAGNLDFNMLNLSDVEKIEIVEGGMSSLYGSSAIGGVVNVITKKEEKPYWLNMSYINEYPMISSASANFGLNYKNLYYNIDINKQGSNGYDLTPLDDNASGVLIRTLEEYTTTSIKHNLKYNFKKNYSIDINMKEYSNNIYQYENHLVQVLNPDNPLYPAYYYESYKNNSPHFKDKRYGITLSHYTEKTNFKISYNMEKYKKSNYFFNYSYEDCSTIDCNNTDELINDKFINAINNNNSLLIQFNGKNGNHDITLGLEANNDNYSSFNIYDYELGDLNDDGLCGSGLPWDPDDCLVESIFDAQDDTKKFSKTAFFIGDQISLKNNNTFSFSARRVNSENYENNSVYSIAYLSRSNAKREYDIRINYSKGFRTPAIKELYYNFQGHSPPVIGNPSLRPTTNNFFSVSIDKKQTKNNFSFEIFYNNVKDLIGINSTIDEADNNILLYSNFDAVNFSGVNCHYNRIINDKNDLKFVYNYTYPKSNNKEALELISKHSLRLNYLYKAIKNKLDISVGAKYSGDKIIYDSNENIRLDDYWMIDILSIIKVNDNTRLKLGYKNLLDYKDNRRFLDDSYEKDLLTTYDPGRRFIAEINLNF